MGVIAVVLSSVTFCNVLGIILKGGNMKKQSLHQVIEKASIANASGSGLWDTHFVNLLFTLDAKRPTVMLGFSLWISLNTIGSKDHSVSSFTTVIIGLPIVYAWHMSCTFCVSIHHNHIFLAVESIPTFSPQICWHKPTCCVIHEYTNVCVWCLPTKWF